MSLQNNAAGKRFEVLLKQTIAKNVYLEASRELLDLDVVVDSATRLMQDQKLAEVCALLHGAPATGYAVQKAPNVRIRYEMNYIYFFRLKKCRAYV